MATTNGSRSHDLASDVSVRPPVTAARPSMVAKSSGEDADADLRPILEELRTDVRALSRQVDLMRKLSAQMEPRTEAVDRAVSSFETLSQRISRAAGEAMRQQHETNLRDVRELWRRIASEAGRINEVQGGKVGAPVPDPDTIMKAFDDRFQWLVDELSEKFMILGNELVRVERQLEAGNHGAVATNGHAEQTTAHNPH